MKDLIFDWDGTLVDTIPFLKETYKKTFAHLGLDPLDYSEIRNIAQQNPEKSIFNLLFSDEHLNQAVSFFYDYTKKNHLKKLKAFSYAEKVLAFCKENKIKCHVFSTKRQEVLEKEINHLNWKNYFDKICGTTEMKKAKPCKQACLAFFNGKVPSSKDFIMIGDAPQDYKTAKNWGCKVVIIDKSKRYQGAEPDYRLKSLKELIPLLQSMLY